jgi:hypothetical protein
MHGDKVGFRGGDMAFAIEYAPPVQRDGAVLWHRFTVSNGSSSKTVEVGIPIEFKATPEERIKGATNRLDYHLREGDCDPFDRGDTKVLLTVLELQSQITAVFPGTRRDVENRISSILSEKKPLTDVEIHTALILAYTLPWDQFEDVLANMVERGQVQIVLADKQEKYCVKT